MTNNRQVIQVKGMLLPGTVAQANRILGYGQGERPTVEALAAFCANGDCPIEVYDAVVDRLRALTGMAELYPPVHIADNGEIRCARGGKALGETSWNIAELNGLFVDKHEEVKGIKWPLQPLVEAWQKRPKTVGLDRRPTAILPGSCQYTVSTGATISRDVWTIDDELGRLDTGRPTGRLLNLERVGERETLRSLIMYDLSGMRVHTGGRGAPLTLRLWHEMVTAVVFDDRENGISRIIVPARELIGWLWPHGNFRPAKHWDKLQVSMAALSLMYVPFEDHLWAVVVARQIPKTPDGSLVVDINIPEGTGAGPLIHRGTLRKFGVESAAKYRLYISICCMWDRYGTTPRGRVQATRPAVWRDDKGNILDARGDLVLKNGKPVKNWNHLRAQQLGDREPNPAADRHYPVLTDSDLVRWVNPLAQESNNERRQRREARQTAESLGDDGVVILTTGKNKQGRDGLRILPPDGWGPKWEPQ